MGFDLVSGLLGFAGFLLGVAFLLRCLLVARDIDVVCVLHDRKGMP